MIKLILAAIAICLVTMGCVTTSENDSSVPSATFVGDEGPLPYEDELAESLD